MSNILDNLNIAQREAVEHNKGPMLIVAGAGTGKTTVLINRLIYLVQERKVDPNEILVVTFTEKATNELIERADVALPLGTTADWICTFHGLGREILAKHALDIGLPGNYRLLDDTAAWIFLKKNLDKFNLDYYRPLGNPDKFLADLLKHFSALKAENISSQEYLEFVENLELNKDNALSGLEEGADLELQRLKELANAYHVYNQLLLAEGLVDYDDLIYYPIKLLRERPNIRRQYQEKFKYIMVDEFQDTNLAQYQLIKLLVNEENSLTVVGDDDQSIYKFRGASLSNILQFRQDFPATKAVVLVDNYRSGQKILDTAYNFIQLNNPNRLETQENLDKRLVSHSENAGEVFCWSYPDQASESAAVVQKIISLQESGAAEWSEMAILMRGNKSADRFVKELARFNVPYQFLSHRGLYFKPIVIDLVNYLRLLDNYHEPTAIFRVLSLPAFFMNHLDILELTRYSREHQFSLYETLLQADTLPKLSGEARAAAVKLASFIKEHSEQAKKEVPSKLIARIVEAVFYPHLDKDKDWVEARLLSQIYRKATTLEESLPEARLKDLVELIDMEMSSGNTGIMPVITDDIDTVKIVTVHSSKGLEFKYVFVVDMVDRKFPTNSHPDTIPLPVALAKENLPSKENHREEERRLFYVAITRAKLGLFLTGARDTGGKDAKKPSVFLSEAGLSPENFDYSETGTELDRAIDRLSMPEPTVPEMPLPKRVSFTQLIAYASCPMQYKLAHILNLPIEKKGASAFGQTMHAVLAEFLSPLEIGGGQADIFGQVANDGAKLITLENLFKIYERLWSNNGYDSKDDADKHYQLGREYCRNFFALLTEQGLPEIFGLEKKFEFSFTGQIIKGTIDRVDLLPDGTLRLVDYKTGKKKNPFGYQEKKQLFLYQLAAEQAFGRKVSSLVFYHFQENDWLEFSAKDKDLEKYSLELKEIIEKINQRDFHATPGFLCQYCDFRNICEFAE